MGWVVYRWQCLRFANHLRTHLHAFGYNRSCIHADSFHRHRWRRAGLRRRRNFEATEPSDGFRKQRPSDLAARLSGYSLPIEDSLSRPMDCTSFGWRPASVRMARVDGSAIGVDLDRAEAKTTPYPRMLRNRVGMRYRAVDLLGSHLRQALVAARRRDVPGLRRNSGGMVSPLPVMAIACS